MKFFQSRYLILTMDNDNLESLNNLAKGLDCQFEGKIKPILSYSKNTNLLEVPDPYYGGEKGFEMVLDLLDKNYKKQHLCLNRLDGN